MSYNADGLLSDKNCISLQVQQYFSYTFLMALVWMTLGFQCTLFMLNYGGIDKELEDTVKSVSLNEKSLCHAHRDRSVIQVN